MAQAAPSPASQAELTPPTPRDGHQRPQQKSPAGFWGGKQGVTGHPLSTPWLPVAKSHRTAPHPRSDPAAGENGDSSSTAPALGDRQEPGDPAWLRCQMGGGVPGARDVFPGSSSSSSSSFTGAGACFSCWHERSTRGKRGLERSLPAPVSPYGSSTSLRWCRTHRAPCVTLRGLGWAGRPGSAAGRGQGGCARGRAAPSVCRAAAPPHRPVFQLIGFVRAGQK